MSLAFIKMHGLGNDFVLIEVRKKSLSLSVQQIQKLADRHTGIGFDQLVMMYPSSKQADVAITLFNADGTPASACGNATRCVAQHVMKTRNQEQVTIDSPNRRLTAWRTQHNTISVDMGKPLFQWNEIPLSKPVDTRNLPITAQYLSRPMAVNVGNPHVVFFTVHDSQDISNIPLEKLGPKIEKHPLFTHGVNVSVAQVQSADRIRLRVWERGTGMTRACGSAACATGVAGVIKKQTQRNVSIVLEEGELSISWDKNDHILMTGPSQTTFTGTLDPYFFKL